MASGEYASRHKGLGQQSLANLLGDAARRQPDTATAPT
jgi:hypothetical protein